nr:hypothetical protein [Caballeronia telluris]
MTVIAAPISTASPVKAREAIAKQRANSSAVSDRSVVRRSRVGAAITSGEDAKRKAMRLATPAANMQSASLDLQLSHRLDDRRFGVVPSDKRFQGEPIGNRQ